MSSSGAPQAGTQGSRRAGESASARAAASPRSQVAVARAVSPPYGGGANAWVLPRIQRLRGFPSALSSRVFRTATPSLTIASRFSSGSCFDRNIWPVRQPASAARASSKVSSRASAARSCAAQRSRSAMRSGGHGLSLKPFRVLRHQAKPVQYSLYTPCLVRGSAESASACLLSSDAVSAVVGADDGGDRPGQPAVLLGGREGPEATRGTGVHVAARMRADTLEIHVATSFEPGSPGRDTLGRIAPAGAILPANCRFSPANGASGVFPARRDRERLPPWRRYAADPADGRRDGHRADPRPSSPGEARSRSTPSRTRAPSASPRASRFSTALLAGFANSLPDALAAPLVLRAAAGARAPAIAASGWRLGLLAAAFVAWSVLGAALGLAAIRAWEEGSWRFSLDSRNLAWKALLSLLVFGVLAGVGRARFHSRKAREASARALRAETLRAESRLAILRAQLNPHFILNVLHSLVGLAERDPQPRAAPSSASGTTLRYALRVQSRGSDRVTLRDELAFTREYLELERLRLGDRLETRIFADDALLDRVVPPFVLQPLVENAVRHAIAPRARGGVVSIRIEEDAEALLAAGGRRRGIRGLRGPRRRGPGSAGASGSGSCATGSTRSIDGDGALQIDRSPLGGVRASLRLVGEPSVPRGGGRGMSTTLRCVVVEDEAESRGNLVEYVSGVPRLDLVGVARTGPKRSLSSTRTRPDLLLLDIRLPEMDGLEVLRRLRHRPEVGVHHGVRGIRGRRLRAGCSRLPASSRSAGTGSWRRSSASARGWRPAGRVDPRGDGRAGARTPAGAR